MLRHSRHIHKNVLKNYSPSIRAYLHGSSIVQSIYPLRMPALSPTMESGQISRWNIKTGDKFSMGDILLTVETDKAEVDVEAQDDGYMGPQLFGPGTNNANTKTVNVGELIAVLGEQSEDVLGTLNIPSEWYSKSSSSSENKLPGTTSQKNTSNSTTPSQDSGTLSGGGHSLKTNLPLSPAVNRLLSVLGIQDVKKIRGTGLHGRLTKGDVLAHIKQTSSPNGTAEKMIQADSAARLAERSQLGLSSGSKSIEPEAPPLDGLAFRQFITEGLSHLTNLPSAAPSTDLSFDSILQDYYHSSIDQVQKPANNSSSLIPSSSHDKYFDGLDQL